MNSSHADDQRTAGRARRRRCRRRTGPAACSAGRAARSRSRPRRAPGAVCRGAATRSSTASTASRMSAPFLVPAAAKSCTRSTDAVDERLLVRRVRGHRPVRVRAGERDRPERRGVVDDRAEVHLRLGELHVDRVGGVDRAPVVPCHVLAPRTVAVHAVVPGDDHVVEIDVHGHPRSVAHDPTLAVRHDGAAPSGPVGQTPTLVPADRRGSEGTGMDLDWIEVLRRSEPAWRSRQQIDSARTAAVLASLRP